MKMAGCENYVKKKIVGLFLIFLLLNSIAAVVSENAWAKTSQATTTYYEQES